MSFHARIAEVKKQIIMGQGTSTDNSQLKLAESTMGDVIITYNSSKDSVIVSAGKDYEAYKTFDIRVYEESLSKIHSWVSLYGKNFKMSIEPITGKGIVKIWVDSSNRVRLITVEPT